MPPPDDAAVGPDPPGPGDVAEAKVCRAAFAASSLSVSAYICPAVETMVAVSIASPLILGSASIGLSISAVPSAIACESGSPPGTDNVGGSTGISPAAAVNAELALASRSGSTISCGCVIGPSLEPQVS